MHVVDPLKKVSDNDQEIPQSQNCRQTRGVARKSHTTVTRHQEDNQSKATSSLFPIEMIEKPEWTQSNTQQNIEQLQLTFPSSFDCLVRFTMQR